MWRTLIPLTSLIILVSGYAIEGSWKLTDIQDSQIPQTSSLKLDVKDFVFRNSSVRWTFTFSGCQNFKYMGQIQSNNLFVDMNTLFIQSSQTQKCASNQTNYDKQIQTAMKKVFAFKIIYNYMAFTDPEGSVVLKFERITNSANTNSLVGAWMASTLYQIKISQILEIDDKQITFCQRQAKVDYKLTGNKLQFSNQNGNQCTDRQLLKAINGTLYYIKRNTTLQLYNMNDELVISLDYLMDLQAAKKQREQQQTKSAQSQTKLSPGLPQNLGPQFPSSNQQFSSSLPLSPVPPVYPPQRYYGKWSISKVFGESSIISNLQFIISKNTILISNQCVTMIQQYSAISTTPFKIQRQMLREMPSTCKNQDAQIYKTGLMKMAVFQLSIQGKNWVIRAYDDQRKQVFVLTRVNDIAQAPIQMPNSQFPTPQFQQGPPSSSFQSTPSPSLSFPSPSQSPSSLQGKYTILLLQKRDIARKIISIQNNSFTLSLCNQYKFTLQVSPPSVKILRSIVKMNPNPCDKNTENIFLDNFAKADNFIVDEDAFVIRDSKGEEIITFNQVG